MCANPPAAFSWLRNGTILFHKSTINSLAIYNVSLNDFTTYTCVVENFVRGNLVNVSFNINLVMRGPPHTPLLFGVLSTSMSVQLQWKGGFNGGDDQYFNISYKTDENTLFTLYKYNIPDILGKTISVIVYPLQDNTNYSFVITPFNNYFVGISLFTNTNTCSKKLAIIHKQIHETALILSMFTLL